jgi:phage FluMu protein Com
MFQRLFNGRYGIDPLSIFIICLAAPFFSTHYFWIIGVLIIAYALFRMFSRNIEKRRRELWVFNDILRKISIFISRLIYKMKPFFSGVKKGHDTRRLKRSQRKDYIFVRCPHCKKTLRLPRNKGKIVVTCPMCRYEFKKKT